jgi:hypothetical protein
MEACSVPEVVGHILLAEGGVGRECQVDLPRGGAGDEVAAVHPRRAHREPVHVAAAAPREESKIRKGHKTETKMQSLVVKMAPLWLVLLVVVEQEVEVDAVGRRRREGERRRHVLLRPCGGQGLGAHDRHLTLLRRRVVLGQAVQEPAGGAVPAVATREVHARPPRSHLGVAQREALAVAAAHRGPAVVLVLGVERIAAVIPDMVGGGERRLMVAASRARDAPGWAGLQRAEHGRRRGRGLGGELGARAGDEGVEEVLGAEGEADELLVAVVLYEEQTHDLGGVVGVQRTHPVKHHLGGLPSVHGVRRGEQERTRSYQVVLFLL